MYDLVQVKYEKQFEPYYVTRRDQTPKYREEFMQRYNDKSSHTLLLHLQGYVSFLSVVLRLFYRLLFVVVVVKWLTSGLGLVST